MQWRDTQAGYYQRYYCGNRSLWATMGQSLVGCIEGNGICHTPQSHTHTHTHSHTLRGAFGTLYFSGSLSKRRIENRRCSEGCLMGDTCWKKPLGMTEVSPLAEGASDSSKSVSEASVLHEASSHARCAICPHYFMRVMRESAQVHCRDKLIYSCALTLSSRASK